MGGIHKKIKNQVFYLTYPPFFISLKFGIMTSDEKLSDSLLAKQDKW